MIEIVINDEDIPKEEFSYFRGDWITAQCEVDTCKIEAEWVLQFKHLLSSDYDYKYVCPFHKDHPLSEWPKNFKVHHYGKHDVSTYVNWLNGIEDVDTLFN